MIDTTKRLCQRSRLLKRATFSVGFLLLLRLVPVAARSFSPFCTLCPSGGRAGVPDQPLSVTLDLNHSSGWTCSSLEGFATSTWSAESNECRNVQQHYATECHCPTTPCSLCPTDAVIPLPNQSIPSVGPVASVFHLPLDQNITCQALDDDIVSRLEDGSEDCDFAQSLGYVCGCNGGQRIYFGQDTSAKRAALVWGTRVSGIISVIASSLILVDILHEQGKKTVYQQLLLALACADVLSSTAWAFSAAAVPDTLPNGYPNGFYGTRGTMATCKAQGFFIQLGLTSAFYNGSLSVYYLVSIYFGYRQGRLERLRWLFHAPPVVLGLAVAFAGLPFYKATHFACTLAAPPFQPSLAPLLVLTVIPIMGVLVIATMNMLLVYTKVRQARRKGDRWNSHSAHLSVEMSASEDSADSRRRPGRGSTTRIAQQEREVFWQGLTYLLAFYLTWIFFLAAAQSHRLAHAVGYHLGAATRLLERDCLLSRDNSMHQNNLVMATVSTATTCQRGE